MNVLTTFQKKIALVLFTHISKSSHSNLLFPRKIKIPFSVPFYSRHMKKICGGNLDGSRFRYIYIYIQMDEEKHLDYCSNRMVGADLSPLEPMRGPKNPRQLRLMLAWPLLTSGLTQPGVPLPLSWPPPSLQGATRSRAMHNYGLQHRGVVMHCNAQWCL